MTNKNVVAIDIIINNELYTIYNNRGSLQTFLLNIEKLKETCNKLKINYNIEINRKFYFTDIITTSEYKICYGKLPNGIPDYLEIIHFDKENANKITIIDNDNNRYNMGDLTLKLQFLEQDNDVIQYFNNATLHINKRIDGREFKDYSIMFIKDKNLE